MSFGVNVLDRADTIAMWLSYIRKLPIARVFPLLARWPEYFHYSSLFINKVVTGAAHRSPAKVLERARGFVQTYTSAHMKHMLIFFTPWIHAYAYTLMQPCIHIFAVRSHTSVVGVCSNITPRPCPGQRLGHTIH